MFWYTLQNGKVIYKEDIMIIIKITSIINCVILTMTYVLISIDVSDVSI